jgi:hypothetical protein
LKDLTGERFGKLTAVKFSHRKEAHYFWLFICDCGNEIIARTDSVGKKTFSCGCFQKEKVTTHKETKTRLYRIRRGMINRCYRQENKDYLFYGGRGISICEEWKNSYEAFRDWANANGYTDDLSIDRIDPDGNYEPSNCQWVSSKKQANNRHGNRLITFNNETRTATQWNEFLGYPRDLIFNRLSAEWPIKKALSTKPRIVRKRKPKDI